MKSAREDLKAFSWVYVVLAVLTLVLLFLAISTPVKAAQIVSEMYSNIDFSKNNPTTILVIGYSTEILSYLWFFWLLRRVSNKKSKGIFVLILLIIGMISNVVGLFLHFSISMTLSLIVDLYIFGLISKIKHEEK